MEERIILERELSFLISDKPTLEDKMNALDHALYIIYNPTYKNNIMIKVYRNNTDSEVIFWERCYKIAKRKSHFYRFIPP